MISWKQNLSTLNLCWLQIVQRRSSWFLKSLLKYVILPSFMCDKWLVFCMMSRREVLDVVQSLWKRHLSFQYKPSCYQTQLLEYWVALILSMIWKNIKSDVCQKGIRLCCKVFPLLKKKSVRLAESIASPQGGFFRRVDHSVLQLPRATIVKSKESQPFAPRHDPSRSNRKRHMVCEWKGRKEKDGFYGKGSFCG